MDDKLQKQLFKKYPKLFFKNKKLTIWGGISCSNGWFNLIQNLCEQINNHVEHNIKYGDKSLKDAYFVDLKEKFSGLRAYVSTCDDYINGLIRMAETMSYSICEECGTNQNVTINQNGWMKALCDKCRNKK